MRLLGGEMIDINKIYRYRNGEEARILCVDRPHEICPVVSMRSNGHIHSHTIEEWFSSKAALENKIVRLSQETIKALDAAASLLLNNLHPADIHEDK
jgi:hypothetical protein